ncbi:MAG: PAS domain S-box protein [Methanoregula sp.]|nr:PAS domain S-box protein [Methanoregula sp.]
MQGLIPIFFIQGVGPTVLRQVILENTVMFFAIASVLVMFTYYRRRSDFFFWFSISLALISIGLGTVLFIQSVGSLAGWAGRLAQYLGFIYALCAVLIARRAAIAKGLPLKEVIAGFFVDAEQSYKQLVETAADAIVTFDDNDRILLWNVAAERMFGYTRDEAVGSSFPELVIDDRYIAIIKNEDEEIPVGGQHTRVPKSIEISGKHKDGTLLPVELTISRRWQNGRLIRTGILRDLTERKRFEEDLRAANEGLETRVQERTAEIERKTESLRRTHEELSASYQQLVAAEEQLKVQYAELLEKESRIGESGKQFRLTFTKAPIGAAIVSLDFRFMQVNEAFCRITGYTAEELTALTFPYITHPDDLATDVKQAQQLVAGEIDRYVMEKRYIRKDGSIV